VCCGFTRRTYKQLAFQLCELSESQIAALKKLAKRTGIKMSELIRRFIDEGLKRS